MRESLNHSKCPKVGQDLCQWCKILLVQTFPEISTLPWYTLLFPLSCLLLIRGLRDLIDDIVSEGEWPWGHRQGGAPLLGAELRSSGVAAIHQS